MLHLVTDLKRKEREKYIVFGSRSDNEGSQSCLNNSEDNREGGLMTAF